MTRRVRRIIAGIGFGLLVIVGFMLYSDVQQLADSLATFDTATLTPVLAIILGGYVLRAIKWEIYLRQLGIFVGWKESLWIFCSGLVMAISPMKVGEVLKSFLLRRNHGISIAKTAPVIVAERLTDVIALVLLASIGVVTTGLGGPVVLAASMMSIGLVALLASPRLSRRLLAFLGRLPLLRRVSHRLEEAYESMLQLVGTKTMCLTVALSVLAWGGEGIACWWIINGFENVNASLGEVVFIFTFSTLAGALSMLPGGLLATEGSMIGLLTVVFRVIPSHTTATAATLLTRFCTLWFAVVLGAAAFVTYHRMRRA